MDLEAEAADLADVVDSLARQTGETILVEPHVQESVTVSLRGVPWPAALELLAGATHCEVEKRQGVWLLTQPHKVTLTCLGSATLRTVLELIAATSGARLEAHPEVRGAVPGGATLEGKSIPEVLNALTGPSGLAWSARRGRLYVGPPSWVAARSLPRAEPR